MFTQDFEKAISYVLKHEGGFVNDPADNGGATKFGISSRFLKSIGMRHDVEFVRNLTLEQAKRLYFYHFYIKNRLNHVKSLRIATKVLDIVVNVGNNKGIKIVQESANKWDCNLKVDGKMGNLTLTAVNKILARGEEEEMLRTLVKTLSSFYLSLNNTRFIKGWLIRANSLPSF